ncbi:hypothetical protein N9F39_01545 [Akkermansiaceae bacterium]|nr:hypothetical protein [Akkermansiaceae bacterium]
MRILLAHLITVFCISSVSISKAQEINEGLMAYYVFNSNANDESGNGVNGSPTGLERTLDRHYNPNAAYNFNGQNGHITTGLLPDSDSFSASLWFRVFEQTEGRQFILFDGDDSFGKDCFIELTAGNVEFRTKDESLLQAPVPDPSSGFWHHLVCVADSIKDFKSIWLDGKIIAQKTWEGTANVGNHHNLTIGSLNDGKDINQKFKGDLDDIRIYNRGLSNSEVLSLYLSESPEYQIVQGNLNWIEARASAEKLPGHLATVNSDLEQFKIKQLIQKLINSTGIFMTPWIGGFRSSNSREWQWVTGDPFSYENWYIGLGGNIPPGTDALYLLNGQYNPTTRQSRGIGSFIVERDALSLSPPTFDSINNIELPGNTEEYVVTITGIKGIFQDSLRVTVTSNNTNLIPTPTLNYNVGEATGTLTLKPISMSSGSATITLTIEDGGLDGNIDTPGDNQSSSSTFNVAIAGRPSLQLGPLYESEEDTVLKLDATPTSGYPTTFTYQWCLNGFKIPPNLGGVASSFEIASLPENEGTWSVTVTNSEGSIEQSFEYRLYVDSDSDGLSDGYEEVISKTEINNPDTDNDGLGDADEVNTYRTNPNSPDSDSDGFTDLYELETAYDPNSAESVPDALVEIMTAIEVKFNAALGATYTIEFSTDNQTWDVIEDDIVGEGGAIERLYSKQEYPTGFFRVERKDE